MAEAPEPSGSLPFSSEDARTITARLLALGTCDTEEFRALLLALFQTPDPETGDVRTADHWLHTPVAWIRFHHTARRELFVPDETGPDHTDLGHTRTTIFFRTSEDDCDGRTHTDMWRMDDQTEPPLSPPVVWTGVTVFACSEPEIVVEQETHDKAAREAKALPRPNEPTEQQRAQHNLTHLPYRSWCEHCVRAKGKERQSKRNTDRQPVIQVDYSFVTTGNDVQQRTILNATDVQTGLSTSVVVPSKKVDSRIVWLNWRNSYMKLAEPLVYCSTTKNHRWKRWSLTLWKNLEEWVWELPRETGNKHMDL